MCAFSFGGMLLLEQHKRSGRFSELVLSAAIFGCASATRSNGILLSCALICCFWHGFNTATSTHSPDLTATHVPIDLAVYVAWHRLCVSPSPLTAPVAFLRFWLITALLGVIAIGPQIAYFVYGMRVYCPSLFPVAVSSSSLLTSDRSWCADVIPNFSAMYMFIQREYWNVGLFRYYELKQLPNFLLAAPVLILSAHSLFQFFQLSSVKRTAQFSVVSTRLETPYYVHWLFLLVNALLVVHIQVTTRLLCACPPLFWAPAASILKTKIKKDQARTSGGDDGSSNSRSLTAKGKLVVGYFLLYNVLGTVLFPAFYPWT